MTKLLSMVVVCALVIIAFEAWCYASARRSVLKSAARIARQGIEEEDRVDFKIKKTVIRT